LPQHLLAQVSGLVGAGAWHFWCRCGKRGVTCANGAHERPFRGAGPGQKTTPAPWTATTCAMDRHHLRPEPPSPAPATTVTCAANSYPRKPTRDSSTKSRVEGRTMRMSA
jgi:hypothetical protein